MPEDSFRNRVILVVDDEERMARFIHLNLEHDGFRVVEAYKGLQAIQALRDSLPDLVLLELHARMVADRRWQEKHRTLNIQHRTSKPGVRC